MIKGLQRLYSWGIISVIGSIIVGPTNLCAEEGMKQEASQFTVQKNNALYNIFPFEDKKALKMHKEALLHH